MSSFHFHPIIYQQQKISQFFTHTRIISLVYWFDSVLTQLSIQSWQNEGMNFLNQNQE